MAPRSRPRTRPAPQPAGLPSSGGRLTGLPDPDLLAVGRLAPGVIDLHVHGGNGIDFLGASASDLPELARWLAGRGTTGWLATYATASRDELLRSLDALREARDSDPLVEATCLGVHLEGPFLAPEKAGAQRRELIREPDPRLLETLLDACEGLGKVLMTLAPERPGAEAMIQTLAARGALVNFGHSVADYETSLSAFRRHRAGATHLWNAMEPMHHRRPGLSAAALVESPRVELIADGAHVHPVMLRLALDELGDRAVVVSDGHPLAGMPEGRYHHWGVEYAVGPDEAGILFGSTLGGSSLPPEGFRRLLLGRLGLSTERVAFLMSEGPARQLGLEEERGRLAPGLRADVLAFDETGALSGVWVGGVPIG